MGQIIISKTARLYYIVHIQKLYDKINETMQWSLMTSEKSNNIIISDYKVLQQQDEISIFLIIT
jgi:hypothetical protein